MSSSIGRTIRCTMSDRASVELPVGYYHRRIKAMYPSMQVSKLASVRITAAVEAMVEVLLNMTAQRLARMLHRVADRINARCSQSECSAMP